MRKAQAKEELKLKRLRKKQAAKSKKHGGEVAKTASFVCHICDVPFAGVGSLERHVNGVHLNLFAHICSLCDFKTKDIRPLRSHMVAVHGQKLSADHKACNDSRFWRYDQSAIKNKEMTSNGTAKSKKAQANVEQECSFMLEGCDDPSFLDDPSGDSKPQPKNASSSSSNAKVIYDMDNKSVQLERDNEVAKMPPTGSQCHVCDEKFSNAEKAKEHYYVLHRGMKLHKCPFCDLASNHIRNVVCHMKNLHSSVIKNPNEIPSLVINNTAVVVNAEGSKSEEKTTTTSKKYKLLKTALGYKCPLCDREFMKRTSAVIHFKSEHGRVKPYACSMCEFTAEQMDSVIVHVNQVHPNEALEQENLHDLVIETNQQRATKVACIQCDLKFKTDKHLTAHFKREHTSSQQQENITTTSSFQCLFCDISFFTKGELSKHRKDNHSRQTRLKEGDDNDSKECRQIGWKETAKENPLLPAQEAPPAAEANAASEPDWDYFTCHICGFWSQMAIDYQEHMFFCHGIVYDSNENVEQWSYGNGSNSGTPVPVQNTYSVSDFPEEVRKPLPPNACQLCGIHFESEEVVQIHMYQCHEPLMCRECFWSVCGHRSLRDHYASQHPGKRISNPPKAKTKKSKRRKTVTFSDLLDMEDEIQGKVCKTNAGEGEEKRVK